MTRQNAVGSIKCILLFRASRAWYTLSNAPLDATILVVLHLEFSRILVMKLSSFQLKMMFICYDVYWKEYCAVHHRVACKVSVLSGLMDRWLHPVCKITHFMKWADLCIAHFMKCANVMYETHTRNVTKWMGVSLKYCYIPMPLLPISGNCARGPDLLALNLFFRRPRMPACRDSTARKFVPDLALRGVSRDDRCTYFNRGPERNSLSEVCVTVYREQELSTPVGIKFLMRPMGRRTIEIIIPLKKNFTRYLQLEKNYDVGLLYRAP